MPGSSREEETGFHPSKHHLMVLDRVTLDTSILVGPMSLEFAIAARLRYYRGHWSNWMVSEFSRVRTEMIIQRAKRDLGITGESEDDELIQGEIEQRLRRSRARVNAAVDDFTRVFTNVNYQAAEGVDLSWLKDEYDIPIMQTAIAVGVPGVLVTDNSRDFPIGEIRNGILIVSGSMFMSYLYRTYPESRAVITGYAEDRRRGARERRPQLPP